MRGCFKKPHPPIGAFDQMLVTSMARQAVMAVGRIQAEIRTDRGYAPIRTPQDETSEGRSPAHRQPTMNDAPLSVSILS